MLKQKKPVCFSGNVPAAFSKFRGVELLARRIFQGSLRGFGDR